MIRNVFISACLMASAVCGATIAPISYSMPNGDYGGYQDNTYSSANCPSCPGFLSGGLGELTDGHIEPSFFPDEGGDPSKLVGWTGNPTIQFFFDAPHSFSSIELHLSDGNQRAGIALPQYVDVTIGGTTLTYLLGSDGAQGSASYWYTFGANDLTGSEVDVTLRHDGWSSWVFADEARFNESAGAETPEPATSQPLTAALGITLLVVRRARAKQTQLG